MDGMYEDGTDLLTIGALARLTGVPVKTIRNWSEQGLLPPAARTPAGYRLYGADAPARLEIVRSLRDLGIGLAAIRSVLHRECTVAETAAPRWDRAGAWTAAALRAHPRPYELDRSAFDGTDPDRVMYAYEQVIRDVSALVAAVWPEDLDLPTPCAGWPVRQLLDHMVWENLMAASIAEDAPRTDHAAGHLDDDHRAAFEDSVRAALAAFSGSGMLRRTYGPYDAPGAMLVQQVVVELLAHGWDLARATGAPTGLAPAVAEETLAAARRIYGAAPRTEGGSFAPERPAPPGAHATDRLAAFLGRDPVVPGRTPA